MSVANNSRGRGVRGRLMGTGRGSFRGRPGYHHHKSAGPSIYQSSLRSATSSGTPPGFNATAWGLLSLGTKSQVLELFQAQVASSLTAASTQQQQQQQEQERALTAAQKKSAEYPSATGKLDFLGLGTTPTAQKVGKRKCCKCLQVDAVGGGLCGYSKCGKFVCGSCAQYVPKKQKSAKRDDSSGEPESLLLCSRCKPQVAYCRVCLDLKEVPDLVHCYFCKRKMCTQCENIVLGKKASKRHYHQCKSCASHAPESYGAWDSASSDQYQPCKSRYCTEGENFEKVTEPEN